MECSQHSEVLRIENQRLPKLNNFRIDLNKTRKRINGPDGKGY